MAGGVSQTPSYMSCESEEAVKAIFKKQIDVFINKDVDFLIAEVNSPEKTLKFTVKLQTVTSFTSKTAGFKSLYCVWVKSGQF